MELTDLPEPLWLASTEHPDWGAPRRAHPRAFVAGPDPRRQYLWLTLDAPESGPGDGGGAGPPGEVVVTPRHAYEFTPWGTVDPLHVHLWVVHDLAELAEGRFAARASSDVWSALWASREEAARRGAPAW
jgi:hypothetical protein